MTFKSLDKALDWLSNHDSPDEIDLDCNIKHRIRYGEPEWMEFSSDEELKNWIEEQHDQMGDEEDEDDEDD